MSEEQRRRLHLVFGSAPPASDPAVPARRSSEPELRVGPEYDNRRQESLSERLAGAVADLNSAADLFEEVDARYAQPIRQIAKLCERMGATSSARGNFASSLAFSSLVEDLLSATSAILQVVEFVASRPVSRIHLTTSD